AHPSWLVNGRGRGCFGSTVVRQNRQPAGGITNRQLNVAIGAVAIAFGSYAVFLGHRCANEIRAWRSGDRNREGSVRIQGRVPTDVGTAGRAIRRSRVAAVRRGGDTLR